MNAEPVDKPVDKPDLVLPPPPRQGYSYPGVPLQLFIVFAGTIGLAIFMGNGIYLQKGSPWLPILMATLFLSMFFIGGCFLFISNRPLVLDAHGITALAFGRPWRSLAWSEITRIERTRSAMFNAWGLPRNGYRIVLFSAGNSIRLDDSILGYPTLLTILNAYIKYYRIPLLGYDKAWDTQATIKATVKDWRERRRLIMRGIPAPITEL